MTFCDKIDKILKINRLGVHSISAMEDYCVIGRNTLKNAYDDNREPTLKTMIKIYDKLGVSQSWWETGKGEPFEQNLTPEPKDENPFENEIIELRKTNSVILRELVTLRQKMDEVLRAIQDQTAAP